MLLEDRGFTAGPHGTAPDSAESSGVSSERLRVFLEGSLPFRVGLTPLTGVEDRLASVVEEEVESRAFEGAVIAVPGARVGYRQGGRIGRLMMHARVDAYRVSLEYGNTLDGRMSFISSGFKSRLQDRLAGDTGSQEVILNNTVESTAELRFSSKAVRFGVGTSVNERMRYDFFLVRHFNRISLTGYADIQGTILLGGQEHAFNDANAGWHNLLSQSANGLYRGSGWGIAAQSEVRVSPRWRFHAFVEVTPPMRLAGELLLATNRVPAVDLSRLSEGETEALLDVSKLRLTQLTLTEAVAHDTVREVEFTLPSRACLGLAYSAGALHLRMTYRRFFNALSIKYGEDRAGVRFTDGISLEAGYRGVCLRFGAVAASPYSRSTDDGEESGGTVIIPELSLHAGVPMRGGFSMRISLNALPFPEIRCGIAFRE